MDTIYWQQDFVKLPTLVIGHISSQLHEGRTLFMLMAKTLHKVLEQQNAKAVEEQVQAGTTARLGQYAAETV